MTVISRFSTAWLVVCNNMAYLTDGPWCKSTSNPTCPLEKNSMKIHCFSPKILFSDEARFRLNGYASKQNCRIWGENQSEDVRMLSSHPDKTTVWRGLTASVIIVFKNEAGQSVTVNGPVIAP